LSYGSVYLSLTHSTLAFRSFLLTLATAWFLTTAVAFAAVRNRNVQIHREWEWSLLVLMMILVELGLAWRKLFANRRGRVRAVLTADIS
jgi:hypothetical protein